MGATILENMPVTRSEDSTLFREISREIFAVRVDRTATCVGFREISREMLWSNAAIVNPRHRYIRFRITLTWRTFLLRTKQVALDACAAVTFDVDDFAVLLASCNAASVYSYYSHSNIVYVSVLEP